MCELIIEDEVLRLKNSLRQRRERFFDSLTTNGITLSKVSTYGNVFDPVPIVDTVNGVKNTKVKLPISYSKRYYSFTFKGDVRSLKRSGKGYYLVDTTVDRISQPNNLWKNDFIGTTAFSMLYYFMYELVADLISRGISVRITDKLFNPLLDDLSIDTDPDLELILTIDPVPLNYMICDGTHLYISLFK